VTVVLSDVYLVAGPVETFERDAAIAAMRKGKRDNMSSAQVLVNANNSSKKNTISFFRLFAQGAEPPDTGGGRVFSLDTTFGLLATVSASALALFFGSALCSCGVSCMI